MTNSNSVELRFESLGVDKKIFSILKNNNFIKPTPIQNQCIPEALQGKDIVGIAQTGTGKTLAFVLPIIQRLQKGKEQAIILAPTRELALQADEMFSKIGRPLGLRTVVIIGGTPIYHQIKDLRKNPDVIIATPGRLLDHLERKTTNLNKIKIVVLDEADHMLDIGFLPDIKKILSLTPKEHQTMLFSATMPSAIVQIITNFMKMPVRIEVAPSGTVATGVKQELFIVDKHSKTTLLEKILNENTGKILIFLRTKSSVRKITERINLMNHSAVEIHSDRSLPQRRRALDNFKKGKNRILVATDIAARGIDVSDISIVINYDLPQNSEDYVHRIGRTGRAGLTGRAISFATPDEKGNIRQIERLIKKTISITTLPKLSTGKRTINTKNDYQKKIKSNRYYKKR
jgi:ATP-dependent RNA helicase RhlE